MHSENFSISFLRATILQIKVRKPIERVELFARNLLLSASAVLLQKCNDQRKFTRWGPKRDSSVSRLVYFRIINKQ